MKLINNISSLSLIFLSLGLKGNSQENTHPNVILVVADDQGMGDMSYFGNKFIKTPAMDKLAEQSTRFSNFIVSPVSAPTRASIMTGRYNYRCGVWDTWKGREVMHSDEVTIAEMLKSSGYTTGMFGKWHLGYNAPSRPMDQGFDVTMEFEEYTKDSANRIDPVMKRNGKIEKHNGFLTDVVFDESLKFIEQNSKQNKPFFAYIASYLVHSSDLPMIPSEYTQPFDTIAGIGRHTKQVYGMLKMLDDKLDLLLKKIDELGIADNTIIIYLSDNGAQFGSYISNYREMRYNYGLRGNKGSVYEGGVKVPCFIRWPGVIEPDRDIAKMAAHIDLLPTIAELVKVKLPANHIDGRSLVPLIKAEDQKWEPRTIIIQFDRKEVPEMWQNSTIRGERYKLINGQELYDLWQDPGESYNIAELLPDKVDQLKAEYSNWYQEVSTERGFQLKETWIGSPVQEEVTLQFFDNNPKGWPLRIIQSGPYEIEVQKIKPELFSDKGSIIITIGNITLKAPVCIGTNKLIFKNVKLPIGNYNYNIAAEGKLTLKEGKQTQEDGFGNVVIRRMKRR